MVLALHELDDQGARRPREAAGDRQHAARHVVELPRSDHQHEPRERQGHGEPLHAVQAFAEKHPGEQQQPERHGVAEHGHLAGAAAVQRHDDEAHEGRGLQQADDRGVAERRRAQRAPRRDQHEEQAEHREHQAQRREGERLRVPERDLGGHPSVAPDRPQDDEREDAEIAAASSLLARRGCGLCGWRGRAGLRRGRDERGGVPRAPSYVMPREDCVAAARTVAYLINVNPYYL